jgi:hypothetical protein
MAANTTTITLSDDGTNSIANYLNIPPQLPIFSYGSIQPLPPTTGSFGNHQVPIYPLPGFAGVGSYAI